MVSHVNTFGTFWLFPKSGRTCTPPVPQVLGNRDFYKIMMEYLSETIVVYVLEAKNLPKMDRITGSVDSFCEVHMRYELNS